jgi:tetratricopeptide (TPR) repeat protein
MPGPLSSSSDHGRPSAGAELPPAEGERIDDASATVLGEGRAAFDLSEALPGDSTSLAPDQVPRLVPDVPPPRFLAAPETVLPTVTGYEVLSLLGRGGMGVVYRARQVALKREVALKMIRAGACAGPTELARFQAEAEAVARLQHPNIVQIHEISRQGGLPYFALEFADGGSLDRKLDGAPLPAPQAARLVETLARAVHHAHQHGILHRDLKPGNVLLAHSDSAHAVALGGGPGEAERYEPKITDFGLAKHLDSAGGQTASGDVLGTPSYVAPEQAEGKVHEIGPATDIYSLGAVLYELLTGRPPFRAESPLETLRQVVTVEPVAPTRLQPQVPRDLETICLKCLQKNPGRRYASAEDLADDLRRFLQKEPIKARPVGPAERLAKWCRRRPTAAALVLVLILAAGVFVAGVIRYQAGLRAERNQAEINFRLALRAVDKMLTEVAEEELASEPRAEQKRRRLLTRALEFYQELLQAHEGDPAVRQETGRAYRRVGDILRILGRHQEAQQAYQQAVAVLRELASQSPAAPEPRQDLAESYNWQGELLRTTGKPRQAREAYDSARRLQEELVAQFPNEPEYGKALARTHDNLGILLKEGGELEAARAEFRQAIDRLQDLAARFPERPEYCQLLARSHLNFGPVLKGLKDYAGAERVYGEAIRRLRALRDADPYKPDYRHELGVACNNLGNLLRRVGRPDEARPCHREAIALFGKLVVDHSEVPVYRRELANSHNSLGYLLFRGKDWEGAWEEWDRARGLLQELVNRFHDVAGYRAGLGLALGNLGRVHLQRKELPDACRRLGEATVQLQAALRLNPDGADDWQDLRAYAGVLANALVQKGDHAEALRWAAALPRALPDRGRGYYLAACFLARCVGALAKQRALKAEKRDALTRQYADQARDLLTEGLRRGGNDLPRLKDDRDFQPLGQRDDFRRLLTARAGAPGS